VTLERQGEADPIIDLMSEFSLSSLLPRGTKTWYSSEYDITIDLVLVSEELRESAVKCRIYSTEHGSDYRTIESTFDISIPTPQFQERLLFKNAL
jgi:hypothetical protein